MKIFSTPEFKIEFEKLIRKNSYKYLSEELISSYFEKNIEDCLDGTKLNGHSPNPFIKKRLGGSGGARLYLMAVITGNSIYFSFIHPKSGALGYENISNSKKTQLLKDVVECVRNNDLYEVVCCEKKQNLIFNKTTVTV
jgi:hypothetical protein